MKRKKRKVKGKVLKKVAREKKRICYFCGSTKNIERHHIIPISIGGKHLQNNKVDICDDCHLKLHRLLDPVIHYLVAIIKQSEAGKNKEHHKIGFIWKNGKHIGKKGGKKKC